MQDADGAITRLALAFARDWQRAALDSTSTEREATVKFTLRLERRDGLGNMLAIARDLKPIADDGDGCSAICELRMTRPEPGDKSTSAAVASATVLDRTCVYVAGMRSRFVFGEMMSTELLPSFG